MKSFKVYPFTLAANQAQVVLAEGAYFRVKTCAGDVAVQFDDNAALGPINAGQGFKVPEGYKRLTIVDYSGAANVGSIIVAGADFVDQTLSGVVSVVDGEKARTLAGGYFTGAPASGIVAGKNGVVALCNPSSKFNLIVRTAEGGSSSAGGMTYVTTAIGNVNGVGMADQSGTRLSCSKAGGALSVNAQVFAGNLAAIPTGPLARSKYIVASGNDSWNPKGGIAIPPGQALALVSNAGTDCNGFFEWFEEAA